jgi:peptidoglycan hydrolase-like protein with peptidoglycan-binding domain
MTGTAVSRFQREHGMEATEMADPATFAAIEAEWAKLTGSDAK